MTLKEVQNIRMLQPSVYTPQEEHALRKASETFMDTASIGNSFDGLDPYVLLEYYIDPILTWHPQKAIWTSDVKRIAAWEQRRFFYDRNETEIDESKPRIVKTTIKTIEIWCVDFEDGYLFALPADSTLSEQLT